METEELDAQYVQAIRHHNVHGRPEIAQRIRAAYEAGEELPEDKQHYLDTSKPYLTPPRETPPPPPRHGQGATRDAWRAWMKEVTDMDHDLIDETNRGDLISIAEAEGLIPRE